MFDPASLTPKSHPYIETTKEAHFRSVLNNDLLPAMEQIALELHRHGRTLAEVEVSIVPTLNVEATVILADGTRLPSQVQWAFDNYFAVTINGTGELSWARSPVGVRYIPGEHRRLPRAFANALTATLRKLNDPGWYYKGIPDRMYEY